MGLLDVLNGMQNGPGGQRAPSGGTGGGGMSPMTMALLGLLAYKAFKSSGGLGSVLGGSQPAPAGAGGTTALPPSGMNPGSAGGGALGEILGGLFGGASSGAGPGGLNPGGLGGLLGGAGAGSVLAGGLGNLIKDLQSNGQGQAVKSWVANGPNQAIAPESLEAAVGVDTLDALAKQTGMQRQDILSGLSQQLPDLVNHLTPDERVPTHEEAAKMV
jgi:uncharacterized protein YidB (DUF937 family)